MVLGYSSMAQLKFVLDYELVKRFKHVILARHGKIELSSEGEEAIKLYLSKYEHPLNQSREKEDPLERAIAAVRSGKTRDALRDLKRPETVEYRSS